MSGNFDFQIQRWFSSCPLEVKGKCLLLKPQCTSDQLLNTINHWLNTRPRGSWAGANLDACSLRTGFHGTRRCPESFHLREAIHSLIQLWCLCYNDKQGKKSLTVALRSCHYPVQQGENHGWHWKPSQLPRASEDMALRGEATTVTLLNQNTT